MSSNKKVLVVDGHPLIRVGVRHIVESVAGFNVVGEACVADDALRLVNALKPDCVIMDIVLPDKSGVCVLKGLAKKANSPAVLILSMNRRREIILEAFRDGVLGYISKNSDAKILLDGLATVLRGEIYIDKSLSLNVVDLLRAPSEINFCTVNGYSALTPREKEVMQLLAEGSSTKEIGRKLFISPKTVNNHKTCLMKKLGFRNNIDIIRYVAHMGLIDIVDWKDS